jgi:hypothetical protein
VIGFTRRGSSRRWCRAVDPGILEPAKKEREMLSECVAMGVVWSLVTGAAAGILYVVVNVVP